MPFNNAYRPALAERSPPMQSAACITPNTIKQVISLADFPYLDLVGGGAGLNRVAENVTFLEDERSLAWCRGNDVIITKLSSFTPDVYTSLFRRLSEVPVSAVILFYPEQYAQNAVSVLSPLADEYKIPLFTARNSVRFSDVATPILFLLEQFGNARKGFFQLLTSEAESFNVERYLTCAASLNLSGYSGFRMLAIRFRGDSQKSSLANKAELENIGSLHLPGSIFFQAENGLVLLVAPEPLDEAGRNAALAFADAVRSLWGTSTVYVGRHSEKLISLRDEYTLIMQAFRLSSVPYLTDRRVLLMETLQPILLLARAADGYPPLLDWAERFLKPILDYDAQAQNDGNLFETLCALSEVELKGTRATAERLHIHPNTLAYRKKQIEKLLRHDRLEHGTFDTELALFLHTMQQAQSKKAGPASESDGFK